MGRGLSELQRDILRRACRNRETLPERMRQKFEESLREWEELKAFFAEHGWEAPNPPSPDAPAYRPELQADITNREVVRALTHPGGPGGSIEAAVSRTMARLIRRGLLHKRGRNCLRLTAEGLARAQELSVNSPPPK
jgi:hypothetical protein